MPNLHAAEKALRKTRKQNAVNAKTVSEIGKLKAAIKKALAGKEAKKAKELFVALQQKVDKATKRKFLKKSAGARIKSRIARHLVAAK